MNIFFRLLKEFQGRFSLHNFVTGGSCPDDAPSMRKIDRLYHKEIIHLPTSCREKDDTDIQKNRNNSNSNSSRNDNKDYWALFSISGDVFLKGQVARVAGLILGN